MKTLVSFAVGVTLILAAASTTSAQYRLGQTDIGISGNGIVSLERDAEIMRMQIQLMATSNNLKEALAVLQTRSDNAKQQVIALGADKASVKVQPAQIVKAANDRQQQIQMMMRQRMQQVGRKKEAAKKAEPIQVAAAFTAEWKLSAKSHDELLTTTHQLQQKLKTLDLAGAKDAKKLSPEEQEALEEAQTEFGGFEDPNAEQPGQPTFLFVAEIPSDELDKAHAEAFQKATAQAERLAKATGRQLGELQAVSSVEQADNDDALLSSAYGYQSADYRMLQLLQRQRQTSDAPVAMGMAPGKVKHTVTLTASYSLKAK